ncbi:hypothetical protein DY000_02033059 [Brassica cretica]|uniref:Uncharacterized protein n=1 Tax=Brassica cretica TaxID=69181 RepID=A0ABQ7DEC3_BRACR|nr:hypothetical protein DY000_02033059 [Brassica cretica]
MKVELLILDVDKNGILPDEEGRARNSARQLIYTHEAVISDVIAVAEEDDFELHPDWNDWLGQSRSSSQRS